MFAGSGRVCRDESRSFAGTYNGRMRCAWAAISLAVIVVAATAAQTPQPFPRSPQPGQAPASPPRPAAPPPATQRPPVPPPAAAAPEPTAQSLGLPIYPAAQYLATYD